MNGETSLRGRRVLVVEDEMMIAMLAQDMLEEFECVVVGPAHTVDSALTLAHGDGIDIALLDVNLSGQPVHQVADALRDKGVPMVFSTGYGEQGLRPQDRGSPVLQKPFRSADLAVALQEALKPR